MNKRIKILLISAGAVITLLLAAIAVVVATVDPNDYKAELAQVVQEKTGRTLVFDGDIGFTFFPSIGLKVGPVSMGNASGFSAPDMIRIDQAEVSLRLAPLVSGEFAVGNVVLDGLTLHLIKNSEGVGNWEDLVAGKAEAAAEDVSTEPATQGAAVDLAGLSVQGVEISNASLIFEDQQKGANTEISDLNLKLGRIQGGGSVPFELGFGLSLDQPKLDVRPIVSGELHWDPAAGSVAVNGFSLSALGLNASGQIQAVVQEESPSFSGSLKLAETSLRQLAQKLGIELPQMNDPAALEELSAEMEFSGTSDSVDVKRLDLGLDGAVLSVQGFVYGFDDPEIAVAAQVTGVDFGRYLPTVGGAAENASSAPLSDEAAQSAEPARAGWETAREALLAMTLDVNLAVEDCRFKGAHGASHLLFSCAGGEGTFSGDLDLSTGSLRELAQELGLALPETQDADTLGASTLALVFSGTGDSAELEQLNVQFDDTNFSAQGSVAGFKTPSVKLAARLDGIDLDRYLPPQDVASDAPASTESQADQPSQPAAPAQEPDLSALRSLDLDAKLDVGTLKAMNVQADDIQVVVGVHDGVVRVSPFSFALYQGRFDGQGTLDASKDVASWAGKGALKGLRPQALLRALLDKGLLRGVASVNYNLRGSGLTPENIVKSLSGNAAFNIAKGALVGVDVGKMIRDGWNQINGTDVDGEASGDLDFSNISGSVKLTNGRIVNKDLAVVSPLVEVSGAGSADLAQMTADYAAMVTVVGSLDGLEGDILSAVQGIPLPVYVRGDLAQPDIGLDVKAMGQALVEGVVEEGLNGLVDVLLEDGDGDSSSDDSGSEESAGEEDSGDEVLNLFENLL